MKYDLVGDLEKDWDFPDGLHNVLVHVSNDTWVSRGPRPTPRWRSVIESLVEKVIQGAARRTVLADLPSYICLGPSAFHSRPVCAALADREASRSVTGGLRFLGRYIRRCSAMVS